MELKNYLTPQATWKAATFLTACLLSLGAVHEVKAQCPVVDLVTIFDSTTSGGCYKAIRAEYHPTSNGQSSMLIKWGASQSTLVGTNAGCMGSLFGVGSGNHVVDSILTTLPCTTSDVYVLMESHSNGTCGGNACSSLIFLNNSPLPVKLVSFDVTAQNNTANLRWTTATESNNLGFYVERSADGKLWSSIGFVPTKADNGNSSYLLNYQYFDAFPLTGASYYRLKQVDMNGQSEYSNVLPLRVGNAGTQAISIQPNPATDKITISGMEGTEVVTVFDNLGRQVLQEHATVGDNTINISQLPAGMFQVMILNQDGSVQGRQILKN